MSSPPHPAVSHIFSKTFIFPPIDSIFLPFYDKAGRMAMTDLHKSVNLVRKIYVSAIYRKKLMLWQLG